MAVQTEELMNSKSKKNVYLMLKNIPILEFNIDTGYYNILQEKLLPFQLKGKLINYTEPQLISPELPVIKEGESTISIMKKMEKYKAELNEYNKNYLLEQRKKDKISIDNKEKTIAYLASRVLPLTRDNAKKIYNLFGFEQIQTNDNKARISLICRSSSLLDDYWVKNVDDEAIWENINLKHNKLSDVVAQVSLHGSSLTLHGDIPLTPELNGQGAYAKAWKRENDELWLYKLGSNESDLESRIEVMVSNILDKTNIPHLKYYEAESQGRYACKCKCLTDDNKSIVSGMGYISYCLSNNLNPEQEILNIDSDNIYKMWIVDYLISNRDRHGMNWGFYYNSNTCEMIGAHPLFDHNNSFDQELMKDKNAEYLFDNRMSMREAAEYAIKRTDIKIVESIQEKDFINKDYYDSFKERASDIGIKLNKEFYKGVMLKEKEITGTYVKNHTCFNETELEKIVLAEGINKIEDYAFCGCSSLKEVILPQSLRYIGPNAFKGCTALENINIPENVEFIGKDAFKETSINNIIVPQKIHIHESNQKYCNIVYKEDLSL